MKTVTICNSCLRDIVPNNFFDECVIDDNRITISLLDVPEPDFTPHFNSHSVIVKIKAFSCNYRDRSYMHRFAKQCQELSGNQKYFYSPIGSEFVGEIIKVGSDVNSFQIGDRVMPDSSYPLKIDGRLGGVVTNFASQRFQLFPENHLIKVPDNMPDETAAAFSLSAQTAYSMVRRANLRDGDNVLITALTSNTSQAIIQRLKSCNININIYGISSKALSLNDKMKDWGLKSIFTSHFLQKKQDVSVIEKFDVIFDPFIDLYFNGLSKHINYDSRYIFCGFYQQHPSYREVEVISSNNLLQLYNACITYNISLMGNCLGCRKDLESAISDYSKDKFEIHIDSVYTGCQLNVFFQKSFVEERIGKVVYMYAD